MATFKHWRWVIALILTFVTGIGIGTMWSGFPRTPSPQKTRDQFPRLTIVPCRPCEKTIDLELSDSESNTDLDRAIAPRNLREEDGEIYWGGRVRLHGVAVAGHFKSPANLRLSDRAGVTVSHGFRSAERFEWDASLVGRRVVIEGCIRRTWFPTAQERYQRLVESGEPIDPRRNILRASPIGYVYTVDVISVELDEEMP